MWDYAGGFGLVRKQTDGRGVPDAKVVAALGLKPAKATPAPTSAGRPLDGARPAPGRGASSPAPPRGH